MKKIHLIMMLFITAPQAFAQKLLDPTAANGQLSNIVASSGGSNSSIALAYSMRQLKTTYDHSSITAPSAVGGFTNSTTPLLRVRRSSDDGQLDIGYLPGGVLDTVTLKNFVGSGSGFVSIWYDQSGNSKDAIQSAAASQPRIVNAGVVEVNNAGYPGIAIIDGTTINDGGAAMAAPGGVNRYGISGDRTLTVVSQARVFGTGPLNLGGGTYVVDRVLGASGGQDIPLTAVKAAPNGNWALQVRNNDWSGLDASIDGSVPVSTTRTDNVTVVRNGSAWLLEVNGMLSATTTLAGVNSMTAIKLGFGAVAGEYVVYDELLLFGSALSAADRGTILRSQEGIFRAGEYPVWTGTVSTDWNTAGNWSNGAVPTNQSRVTIPSGTARSLVITSGQTTLAAYRLTVNTGATATIDGNLSVIDSVNVNGSIGGSGTIILNGTADQYIKGTLCGITNNKTASSVYASGALSVNGTLTNASGATLNMGIYQLSAVTSVNNNGTIRTVNTGATPAISAGKTWGGTVVYEATTGNQKVAGGTYNNLTLTNASGSQIANGDITLSNGGSFTNTAGGTLNMGDYLLIESGTATFTNDNGAVRSTNTSTTPVPSGKTWGGTIWFAGLNQSIPAGTYYNLIVTNASTSEKTARGNITINGSLLIASSSATLNMGVYALFESGNMTVTSVGTVRTATSTIPAIPSGKTWGGTVIYDAATGGQRVAGGTYNILTFSNTSGSQAANGDITMSNGGTLTVTAGGTLNMGVNALSETGTATFINNGTIATGNASATPLPARNWTTGTINYNRNIGGQTVIGGTYNNLTMGQFNAISTASGNIEVNGALTIVNTDAILNMSTYVLSGTLSTINNNGSLRTYNNASSTPFPPGKNWGTTGTVEYAAATGGQTVVAGTYYKMILYSITGVQTAGGGLHFPTTGGGLTTHWSTGVINMSIYALTAPSTGMNFVNNGTIITANTSATPMPEGVTWGGTINYNSVTGGQSIISGTYNNLILGNTSGTQSLNGTTTVSGALTFSGGKLALGSNTLNVNGTLNGHSTNNSFIANGTSNVSIGGSGALGSDLYFDQTTPGTTNRLNNLTYNRSSQTVSLGNALQVAGIVTPTAGTLATNNRLTLVSNASNTASIAAGSGSYITGNVTAERYIPGVARRFRFLASPVIGATLADWQNEIYITGAGGATNGFDATVSNQASAYSYNEAAPGDYNANGWVGATNTGNPIPTGKGFRVLVRGDRSDPTVLTGNMETQVAVTMNTIGAVNIGNITMPVTFTSSGNIANDGWNLMGNPYPSAIDWNAFHDAGRTGISPDFSGTDYAHLDAVATVYDANTNAYASYNAVSNIGTGALSNGIIPSGGAFWVKSSAASPSMTMKEMYKTGSTPAAMFKAEGPQAVFSLRLVKDEITADEMIVKYIDEATDNFDRYDIAKLNGEVNISSVTGNGTLLTGNCKPFNGISDSIRLNITVAKSGNYVIEAGNVKLLAPGKNVYLVDAFANTVIDLNVIARYDLVIDKNNPASYGNNRLMIVVGDMEPVETSIEEVASANAMTLYPALTNGEVKISNTRAGNDPVSITILDATGKELTTLHNLQWNNNTVRLDLSGYKAGAYIISVLSASGNTVLKCVKYE